jgi:hypothetical protein
MFKHPTHAIQAEPIDDDATNNTKHCDYLLGCYVTMIYVRKILNSEMVGNIGQLGPIFPLRTKIESLEVGFDIYQAYITSS